MTLYRLTNGLGHYYVVSSDPTGAEKKLLIMLDKADYGFTKDRKVTLIEPIAEELGEFPEGKPNFSSDNNLIL